MQNPYNNHAKTFRNNSKPKQYQQQQYNNNAKNKQHQYNNNAKTKQQQCQNKTTMPKTNTINTTTMPNPNNNNAKTKQQCQKQTTSIQQQCQTQTTTMPKQNNNAKNKQHQYNNNVKTKQQQCQKQTTSIHHQYINNAKTKHQQCQNQVPYNNLHVNTQYYFHSTTTDRKHKTHNNQIPQLFAIAIFLPDFDSSLFTCIVPNVCNLLRKMSIIFSWIFIYLLLSHNSNENKMCQYFLFNFLSIFFQMSTRDVLKKRECFKKR